MNLAIYFFEEQNEFIMRRIDSMLIEPLHKSGYIIIKISADGTQTRLEPNEEIPDGFIQDSEYGEQRIDQEQVNVIMKARKAQEGGK